ncbi:MAG TPA: AraC family transcriptional regulator [Verrucomicrobiae bacterium]|jgi:AraC-like DNA-binding protein|nr:AraC family transcriptional regulator [Verrucomicrobiae bacterium]
MQGNSVIKPFDWRSVGRELEDNAAECIFWTGRNEQLCAQYFRPMSDVYYPSHSHSEYTIVVCLAGEVIVHQLGLEHTIGPGEAMIGNWGVPHTSSYRAQGERPCEAVTISLDHRLLRALTADFKLPTTNGVVYPAFTGKVQGPILLSCAREIAQELKTARQGHKIIIESQAIRLLIETIRLWPASAIEAVPVDLSPRLPRLEFVRAYEFMRWCRKESFRLELLCRFLGSSEERFTRLFLASTDQTPATFYNRMLLDRATDLLSNPALSIKEIGFDLGFKTSSHFIATFRRKHGVSPQKYREQNAAGTTGNRHQHRWKEWPNLRPPVSLRPGLMLRSPL